MCDKLACLSINAFRCIGMNAMNDKIIDFKASHLSGEYEIRTRDLLLARQALSQLS